MTKYKCVDLTNSSDIHQYYLDIINAIPSIVYWVDSQCNLLGCSHQFVQWLGVKKMCDLLATPYDQMKQLTTWSESSIDAFKLDDMQVIFSGVSQYNRKTTFVDMHHGKERHYDVSRVPLFDKSHQLYGLVVVLSEIIPHSSCETTDLKQIPAIEVIGPRFKKIPVILMVEDNFVAQQVVKALLIALHCRVDTAGSGDKALALFKAGKYDFVFMDIGLEDTSGYIVAKKMREMESNTPHHVPIIALTTYQADVVQYDCRDYCMDGVLTKPLTREQAEQLIQHYIFHQNVSVTGLQHAT